MEISKSSVRKTISFHILWHGAGNLLHLIQKEGRLHPELQPQPFLQVQLRLLVPQFILLHRFLPRLPLQPRHRLILSAMQSLMRSVQAIDSRLQSLKNASASASVAHAEVSDRSATATLMKEKKKNK